MRLWRAILLSAAAAAAASSAAAQTPVLSSLAAPYAALQNTQPIHLAGNSYGTGQVAYGPVGTPLVLAGSNLGEEGEVWFVGYKNGAVDANAASVRATATLWTPTTVFISVPAGAKSGLVKVVTDGKTSNGLPFVVMPGGYSCPAAGPPQNQLQIQTSSLQDGAVGKSYSAALKAIGGSGSYAWSLVGGSLPSGLALSSSGVISGTPSSASGPVSITVQVADTSSPQQHEAATLSVEVAAQAEAVSSSALYSFSISNAGGGSGYDGVGNVKNVADSVNGTWSFAYDTLNRLATSAASQADDPYPNYCWQYDSFGNRLAQTSSATAYASTAGGANACPVTSGPSSWAQYNGTVNGTGNNQMSATSQNASQGQYYDASGNITNDGLNAYLYDGEGRVCAVRQQIPGVGSAMTQYLYDADGNRVAKGTISTWSCDTTVNGFTAQSAYVLGPDGGQLTEMSYSVNPATGVGAWQWAHTNVEAGGLSATYDADPTGKTAGPMYFHLSDWLGTRRQQTDYAGNPVLNFTGLPFGDGLGTIPVSNTDAADATEHHFTGKERDSESGLDYFGARYYASNMGRFMSPDPKMASGHPENPQSWNRYSYTLNNPLGLVDPDGKEPITITVYTWIPYKGTWMFGNYSGGPKTVSRFTIETNPAVSRNPVSTPAHEDVQPTVKTMSDGTTKTATAPASAGATGERIGDASLIRYTQSDTNPLAPVPGALAPAIKVDMTLAVPNNGSMIAGTVTTSDYPAMQVTATYQNGDTQLLYSQMPVANTTLLLIPTGTTPISSSRNQNICGVSASCQTVPNLPQQH